MEGTHSQYIIHMVQNIIEQDILDLVYRWKYANIPFRKVMIKMNFCYICKRHRENIYEINCDDYDGRFNHYGWIYCKRCAYLCKMGVYHYYNNCNYLTYRKCQNLLNIDLSFWRDIRGIVPYQQTGSRIDEDISNVLTIYKNRIIVPVFWKSQIPNSLEFEYYNKMVTLANLLMCNPKLFGNNIVSFPIRNLNHKWHIYVEEEYRLIREWKTILPKIQGIPMELQILIFQYWNGLNIM